MGTGNHACMIDSQKKLATVATCFMLVLGGFGAAGCGDDDNEEVAEEAGQEIDEAGNDAGEALDEAGEDVEAEANEEEDDEK